MPDSNTHTAQADGSRSSGSPRRTAGETAASRRGAASRTPDTGSGVPNGAASGVPNGAVSGADDGGGAPGGGAVGRGLSAGAAVVRAVGCVATDGANRAVEVGAGVWRASVSAVGGVIGGPKPGSGPDRVPVAEGSVRIPFATASMRMPGPGAVVSMGTVRVTLPTGALYYGGLTALAIAGTLEAPVAAGAAVAGLLLGRRWLSRSIPRISVCDAAPVSGPQDKPEPAREGVGSASS